MSNLIVPATLKAIRASLNLTQQQLAERLGVSFTTINRWEGGKTKPQRAARNIIAEMASTADLKGYEEPLQSDKAVLHRRRTKTEPKISSSQVTKKNGGVATKNEDTYPVSGIAEHFPLLTMEFVRRVPWRTLLKGSASSYHNLETFFRERSREHGNRKDEPSAQLYSMISQICSFHMRLDRADEPFGPLVEMSTGRSMVPGDLTEANLAVIEAFRSEVSEPLLGARLADVLWLRKRDRLQAQWAIDQYLKLAKERLLDTDRETGAWLDGHKFLKRASQLWMQLGCDQATKTTLFDLALRASRLTEPEPRDFYRVLTLQVVAAFCLCDDPLQWEEKTREFATAMRSENNFRKEREYIALAIEFAKYAKNNIGVKELREMDTDSYVDEARTAKNQGGSALAACNLFATAIEACRRLGGRRSQVDELHSEMNELQVLAMKEMKSHVFRIDLSEPAELARQAVAKVNAFEAIDVIASMAKPRSSAVLYAEAEANAKKFVFQSIISSVAFDEKGRVVTRTPPVLAEEADSKNVALKAAVVKSVVMEQSLKSLSMIEAARAELQQKWTGNSELFKDHVHLNRFVPDGRERIFERGLYAGLQGDWLTCCHVLIPQVENSLRHLVEQAGLLVTHLSTKMTQTEHDLNTLLYNVDGVKEFFGEDLTLSLQVLLVEPHGKNLRNRLCHGRLPETAFDSPDPANFLWAMTLYLCQLGRASTSMWVDRKGEVKG